MSGSAIGSNFYDFKHAYLSNVPLTANSVSSLTGKPNGEGSIASFFGRVNYNYQEKYMASVIMRADGSSLCPRTPLGILPFSIRRMGYQQRVLHVRNQMAGLLKATRFLGAKR